MMRVGECYRIFGTVTEIKKGKLMCLVKVEILSRSRMASVMTIESLKELGVAGSPKSAGQLALSCQACGLPEGLTVEDISRHMLMIMLQDFMDPWTFNQKNLMKCCKEFLLPGGKQIPFCAYNTIGYREQARAQLDALEPERVRARKEGRAFVPRPVTFEFDEEASPNGHSPLKLVGQ